MGLAPSTNMTVVYSNLHSDSLNGRTLSFYYLPSCSAFLFFFFFPIAFNCVKLVMHTLKSTKKPLVSLIKTTSLRLVESDQHAPLKTAGFFIKSFCIHA